MEYHKRNIHVLLQLQCKSANHDNYHHRSQDLFQAAQRDDAEAVARIFVGLELTGYKLSAPELKQNGENVLHYALDNGHNKVMMLSGIYNCAYF